MGGKTGKFKPINPGKYKGNPSRIIYRSSWECRLMVYLDKHSKCLEWASEEPFMVVPYRSPLDKRMHRYFPDFWVKQVNRDGETEELLIEVKPHYQTTEPVRGKKKMKTFIREASTWKVNEAKWIAAREFSERKGWDFRIFTEYELGILKL